MKTRNTSDEMNARWLAYQRKFDYARNVEFADCIAAAKHLLAELSEFR